MTLINSRARQAASDPGYGRPRWEGVVDSLPEATYHDIVKLVVMLHGDDCSEAWQRLAEVFLHADEALSRLKDELCLQAA